MVVPRTRVCGFSREESVTCAGPVVLGAQLLLAVDALMALQIDVMKTLDKVVA
jgi:hypothetical protein